MARYVYTTRRARGYGLSNLTGDILLTILTGGLWLIWWIIREVTR
jgi:hypothetical protein